MAERKNKSKTSILAGVKKMAKKRTKTPILDGLKEMAKNKVETPVSEVFADMAEQIAQAGELDTDNILKSVNSDTIKMWKHHALYMKYRQKIESTLLAARAGFNSDKQYFKHIAEVNKKIDELRERKVDAKSKIPLPDVKSVAKSLLEEGFSDNVDREFLRKKTLEVMLREEEMKKLFRNQPLSTTLNLEKKPKK